MTTRKYFIALFVLLYGSALAEDSAQETAAAQPTDRAIGPALTTSYVQRGEALQAREDIVWFEFVGERYWLLRENGPGSTLPVLVLGDSVGAPNGSSFTAKLRSELGRQGWNTFYFARPSAADVSLLNAAASATGDVAPLVVGAQGSCLALVEYALAYPTAGLICVAVPVSGSRLAVIERLQGFADLQVATLVLQQAPLEWPAFVGLGTNVEIHLLPRGSSKLRKVRGWLRRRFGEVR